MPPTMDNVDRDLSSDIAVIGMACRFPGGASSPSKFWELLLRQTSAYTEVPSDRYNAKGFYHAGGKMNTLNCEGGHFLQEDLAAFDASFFRVKPQEASALDPAGRKLLEVTYEALEDAGLAMETVKGTDTSCYVGSLPTDYHEMLRRDPEASPRYTATGIGPSLLSGHISHFFDFHGASMTLDTACASGLVAVHQACQSLQTGGSRLAIVGAANLIFSPDFSMSLNNLGLLSADGRSRSFTCRANGYGRGEGVAVIVLKPLATALKDGDSIRAVIRNSVVGHNGGNGAITTPQLEAQERLIHSAYASKGLQYSDTGFFEAHGTGTAAGDRTELTAIGRTVGQGQPSDQNLLVGSVKAVIGHCESAAGLAGLIKCILMLERGTVVPHLRDGVPDTKLPLERWNMVLPTSSTMLPSRALTRASVNSFGYSGTNAHVILERGLVPPRRPHHKGDTTSPSELSGFKWYRLFFFSAQDGHSLERMKERYKCHVESTRRSNIFEAEGDEAEYLARLSYTLSERRSRLPSRTYVVASSLEELMSELTTTSPSLTLGPSSPTPPVVFVFTGQGAQWCRMGLELLRYPVVRDSVDRASTHLTATLHCPWSLQEEWGRDDKESNIHRAYISQPLTTIIQVAMVDLFRSWGVRPEAVIGHSSGEIAAAYSCGAISREDAWTISYWRGMLCTALSSEAADQKGSMMAVGLSKAAVQIHLDSITSGRLWVACENSPSSVTISGDQVAIDDLDRRLRERAVFCRTLRVENAYHSPHMERIAARYLAELSSSTETPMERTAEGTLFASSVTGELMNPSELVVGYWVRNLVSPVLFSRATEALLDAMQLESQVRCGPPAAALWIEVGPHAALAGPVTQIMTARNIKNFKYTSTLRRGVDAAKSMLHCAGLLTLHGIHVGFRRVNGISAKPLLLHDLPVYPWNHTQTFWAESRLSKNYRFRKHAAHDFLGTPALDATDGEPKWRLFIRVDENPWIRHHVVGSKLVYPIGGILAMVVEAMRRLAEHDHDLEGFLLEQVQFLRQIVVVSEAEKDVEVILRLRRHHATIDGGPQQWQFTLTSHGLHDQAEEVASGLASIRRRTIDDPPRRSRDRVRQGGCARSSRKFEPSPWGSISPQGFYHSAKSAGYHYGPLFRGLSDIKWRDRRVQCALDIPDVKMAMPQQVQSDHLIHPVTFDMILQSLLVASGAGDVFQLDSSLLPVSLARLTISASLSSDAGTKLIGYCLTSPDQASHICADICYWDPARPEAEILIEDIRGEKLSHGRGSEEKREAFESDIEVGIHTGQAGSLHPFLSRVEVALVGFLAAELGIQPSQIDRRERMNDYGVDSLVAPKLSRWVEQKAGAKVLLAEVLEASVSELLLMISRRSTSATVEGEGPHRGVKD